MTPTKTVKKQRKPQQPKGGVREFKGISDRAKQLLSREEGFDVDFKKAMSGLESDDLVSFANSKDGGTLLIGVEETKDVNGRQQAVVVGCPVGDAEKLKILSRATQCVPPIQVSIYIENSSTKPFYRIEIPSGPYKPYCTSGATYKTRGDGRKEPLNPPQLLALFLETEGGEFLRRFQQATTSLETAVQQSRQRITEELDGLNASVSILENNIQTSLEGIEGVASDAQSNAEEANNFSQETFQLIDQVHTMVEDLAAGSPAEYATTEKLDALIEHFGIEDPAITKSRRYIKALALGLKERGRKQGCPVDERWMTEILGEHMKPKVKKEVVAGWVAEVFAQPGTAKKEASRLARSDRRLLPIIISSLNKKSGSTETGKPKSKHSGATSKKRHQQ